MTLATYQKLFIMKLRTIYLILSLALLMMHCTQNKSGNTDQEMNDTPQTAPKPSYKLEQVWASDSILKTPESVIHDEVNDVFYVSNVNQNPWEKDNNGFISRMSTDGEVLDLEWVTGFSGPKGMAIVDDILFVADLDELVLIDINGGEVKEKILVDGASGLNDITPSKEGGVYVTDSNEGKIFKYESGEVTVFNDEAPGRPNGLYLEDGKLYTAFSQTSEFVYYNPETLEKTIVSEGIGAGDGIMPAGEKGKYLVSDWNGEVFMIDADGTKQPLLQTKDQGKNTADIWFMEEQKLLLVPTFFDNRIVAYRLVKN
jgi:sugar lactone lactonase YvrE